MNRDFKKKNNISNISRVQSFQWKIFGAVLLATAMTGIQDVNRYVPSWLYIFLGLTTMILILSYLYPFIKKIYK